MEGKKKRGRLRMMLLDWMMKEDYRKLEEELNIVVNGVIGRTNLPRKAESQKEDRPTEFHVWIGML